MGRVELPPKFVIPGGTRLSAQLDVARAVIRRAERRTVALAEAGGLAEELLRFLNRAPTPRAMARFADVDEPELFAGREREEPEIEGGGAPPRWIHHDVEIEVANTLVIDEPRGAGGADAGPPPPARSLPRSPRAPRSPARCAGRKGWELGEVEVEVEIEYGRNSSIDRLTVALRVPEPLDEGQQERLLAIAAKCPVHRALAGAPGDDHRSHRVPDAGALMDLGLGGRLARSPARAAESAATPRACWRGGRIGARRPGRRRAGRGRGRVPGGRRRRACPGPRRHRRWRRRPDRRRRRGALRPPGRPRQQRRHRAGATSTWCPRRTGTRPGS